MEWGDKEDFLIDLCSLGINPSAYENEPSYDYWMKEFVEAFDILSSRRSSGLFPNPIAFSEIILYDRVFNVSYSTELFLRCIIQMDIAFIEFVVNKPKPIEGQND